MLLEGGEKMRKIKFATPDAPGLHELINAENSSLKVLNLAVLNLAGGMALTLSSGEYEVCFVPVAGQVQAKVGEGAYSLAEGDCLYVPRRQEVTVFSAGCGARVVVCKAGNGEDSEIIHTRYGDAWQADHEVHGKYNFTRDVVNLVRRGDNASKIVAGITVGQDGMWTSWPPHHHSETLEEIYYYFDIPASGFGVHIAMFMDGDEQAEIVRSGDAVIVPDGYHPTVASPGSRMKYIWFLGAKRTEADRRAKTVNHPSYA
jgi:5-deoxy-glucuronate isomerase